MFSRGSQDGLIVSPQSRLDVCCCQWMCRAVQLEKKGTKVLTSVFRKKTHMDRYLHFDSNHPARVKRGIIQCLRHRAETVCDGSSWWREIRHLRQVFKANSYPEAVVKRNLRARQTSANSSQASQPAPSSCYFRTSQDSVRESRECVSP